MVYNINFISFGISDLIDILLVALILYLFYNLVKGTSAINIFIGLAFIYFVFIVIKAFDLKLLSSILGKFVDVGVIAVMIVFQQEIRKFLLYIGSNEFLKNKNLKSLLNFQVSNSNSITKVDIDINILTEACFNMSKTNTGAIIIIAKKSDLKFYINTGEFIDSHITTSMIENIFYKNSPLHDGAVIIQDNRIIAARCILPVTDKQNLPQSYGMRHRAAFGITENTDAIAITVSEQTGSVSMTINGEINANISKSKLYTLLEKNIKY